MRALQAAGQDQWMALTDKLETLKEEDDDILFEIEQIKIGNGLDRAEKKNRSLQDEILKLRGHNIKLSAKIDPSDEMLFDPEETLGFQLPIGFHPD